MPDQATSSAAEIATPNAARYLTQLCKHFEHKLAVQYDAVSGRIGFSAGEARLQADTGLLRLAVTAPDPASRTHLEDVVARHLQRFAFREDLQVVWHNH